MTEANFSTPRSPASTDPPVVLVGETMMVFNGPRDAAISIGSPVETTFAGAESNVAIGLARLGHAARFVSTFGDDLFGRLVLRALRGEGVDVSHVRLVPGQPTGAMFKSHRPGAEPVVLYYRRGSAFAQSAPAGVPEASLAGARVIFLSGITPALGPACRDMTVHLLAAAGRTGVPVYFDVNHRRKLWSDEEARETILAMLPQVHTLLLGVGEAEVLVGKTDPRAAADALLSAGAPRVVLKAGAGGAYAFTHTSQDFAPAHAVDPVDPIGAGDAFDAGFLSGQLDGLSIRQSLERGNALGALCCLTRGDWEGLPDRRALADFLAANKDAAR